MDAGRKGPIFVVGPPGTGTTLMRLILDSHPNIAIAQETGFARAVLAQEWVPFWTFGGEWYERLGLTRDQLEAEMRDFYGRLFGQFAQSRGATRWGDKTPFHVWHLQLLARVFPDAQFIGMTRHCGAAVRSNRRRMGHQWRSSLRLWVRDNMAMLSEGAALGDRFVLCRYEDLVTSPEEVLRDLFGWLDEPWSDRLLDFHEVHSQRGTQAEVEGGTRSDRPMDPSRVGAWMTTMGDDRWTRLRRGRSARLARFLGYKPTEPLPVRGWGDASTGLLLRGSGLARLRETRRGVDWSRRPRPSFQNRPLTESDLERLQKRANAGARPSAAVVRLSERTRSLGKDALDRLSPDSRQLVRRWWQAHRR